MNSIEVQSNDLFKGHAIAVANYRHRPPANPIVDTGLISRNKPISYTLSPKQQEIFVDACNAVVFNQGDPVDQQFIVNQVLSMSLTCGVPIQERLRSQGYCLARGQDYVISEELQRSFHSLIADCQDLPIDPRAIEENNRYRRFGRFIHLPWGSQCLWWPGSSFYQDSALNPEDGGVVREFAGLTKPMVASKFLRELIRFDFSCLPLGREELAQPFAVGAHIIKIVARPGVPGKSSPNRPHQDGEPFTFIHLLARENVVGGESEINDVASEASLFNVTLSDHLDTLVVRDEAVKHWVKPVEVAPGKDEGFRTVLLIDFAPMFARINNYGD